MIKIIITCLFIILISLTLINSLPTSFDWRNKDGQNWMTPVKDQGTTCGSCWAFSAVGTVEAQYKIAKNNSNYNLDLSEEYLVSDCFQSSNPFSDCRGGWNYQALGYIRDYGIPNETCFQYNDYNCGTLSNGACSPTTCTYNTSNKCSDYTCSNRCGDWQSNLYKVDNYESVSLLGNVSQIETYLVNHGPVAASMRMNYGYFDSNQVYHCSTDFPVNHAIIITGYNQTGQYWMVKNSWGSSWGPNSNGYFKVGFGECGIESMTYGADLNLCTCSNWSAGSCGGSNQNCKTTGYREYTRTCNPTACSIETNCSYDFSCIGGGGTPKEITVCASGCNYTTIQSAINNSNNIDIVSVTDSRTYNEQLKMNYSTASRLQCLDNAIIQGSGTGIGINITNKDSFSISGCTINSFSYGVRIWNTNCGTIENTIISNNAYGIFIQNQSHDYQLINVKVTGNLNKGIRLETDTWGSSYVSEINIKDSNISNNGYVGVYNNLGIYNDFENNKISNHVNYGIHMWTNDWNAFNTIQNNNQLFNNGKGIYLEVSNSNTISSNIFCPSNTNYDIDIGASSSNSGSNNTCEKPGSWNDAGITGCSYLCDKGASVTLLFPPNNYVNEGGNVDLICEADDNSQLVNVSLYHNLTGTWQLNQTKSISGTSNITTFSVNNLLNGTNFIWNCLAYNNNSRGNFASANWSVSIIVNNIPPNDTSKFYIKNSIGSAVAWIGNLGNIVLKGNCFSGGSCSNPGSNSFIIKNASNINVAFVNSTGDLCIVKGDCSDESTSCNPATKAFVMKNSSGYNMSYIDLDGDLCLTGRLYENSEYL